MKSIGFSNFRPFQAKALEHAHESLVTGMVSNRPTLVVLEAPTASGKTVITAGLLEQFMAEVDSRGGLPTILWLSYSPALNDQSKHRIEELTELTCLSLTTDSPVTQLERGRVYFMNIGLLGRAGGAEGAETAKKAARASLKKAVLSAIKDHRENFLVVIDEAHRGADSSDQDRSLVQKLLEAPAELPDVALQALGFEAVRPNLVLAITATPTKLLNRYTSQDAPVFDVQRTPAISMLEVANHGLLKRVLTVESGNFATATTSALSAFKAACAKRDRLESTWKTQGAILGRVGVIPLLLVQLPNRDEEKEFDAVVKTMMVDAVAQYGTDAAHVIQGSVGLLPRFVDANAAREDTSLRVLFYQSALDEGWDCPRAQLLISLRTQLEQDRITQIIGRILRMPGAEHTGNLDCDTAYLWAPLFDAGSAEAVKKKLEEGFTRADGSKAEFVVVNHATLTRTPAASAEVGSIRLPATKTVALPISIYQGLADVLAILDDHPASVSLAQQLKRDVFQALLSPSFMGDLEVCTDLSAGWTRSISALDSATVGLTQSLATTVRYAATPDAVLALRPKLTNSELGPVLGTLLAQLMFLLESQDEQPLVGAIYRLYNALEQHAGAMRSATRHCLLSLMANPELPTEAFDTLQQCLCDKVSYVWGLPEAVRYPTPKEDSPENRVSIIPKDAMQRADGSAFTHLFKSSWEKTALGRVISDDVVAVFRNPESHDQGGFSIVYRNTEHRLANYFPDFLVFRKEAAGLVVDFAEPKGGDIEGPNKKAALIAYVAEHSEAGGLGHIYWGDPKTW